MAPRSSQRAARAARRARDQEPITAAYSYDHDVTTPTVQADGDIFGVSAAGERLGSAPGRRLHPSGGPALEPDSLISWNLQRNLEVQEMTLKVQMELQEELSLQLQLQKKLQGEMETLMATHAEATGEAADSNEKMSSILALKRKLQHDLQAHLRMQHELLNPDVLPAEHPTATKPEALAWKALYAVLEVNESREILALRDREAKLRDTLQQLSSNEYLARVVALCHIRREEGYTGVDIFDDGVAGNYTFQEIPEFVQESAINMKSLQRLGGLTRQERLECVPHLQRLGFDVVVYDDARWEEALLQGISAQYATPYCAMAVYWDGKKPNMAAEIQDQEARGGTFCPADPHAQTARNGPQPFGPRDAPTPRFAVKDRVLAKTGDGWLPGTITFTWWRHPCETLPGKWAFYEIRLDCRGSRGCPVYCYGDINGEDTDEVVRAL